VVHAATSTRTSAAFLGFYRPFWQATLDDLARYVERPRRKEKERK
jgi:hypothetical protein